MPYSHAVQPRETRKASGLRHVERVHGHAVLQTLFLLLLQLSIQILQACCALEVFVWGRVLCVTVPLWQKSQKQKYVDLHIYLY